MIPAEITAISNPNERAFMAELYSRYRKLVYHHIIMWIDCPEEQDDVAQDVWAKILQKKDLLMSLEEPQRARYITYCAKNTALSRLKEIKSNTQRVVPLDEALALEQIKGTVPSAEEAMILNEWKIRFRHALSSLSERDRLLLEGKYLFNESDAALAEWLGCKPSSVRMALTRAKRAAIIEIRRQSDEQTR